MDETRGVAWNALVERFQAPVSEFRGEVTLALRTEVIVEACRTLRDEFGFDLLSDETAVDYWPQQEPRFHVVYQVRSLRHNLILTLRVPVPGTTPTVPTIE